MQSINHPIINKLFPSFITGATNFNNTLRNRQFIGAVGPATPNHDWVNMFSHWEPIQYLLGGTLAMRAAREKYLPKSHREDLDIYEERLLRSVLYGAYSRTVNTLTSLPFLTPTQVKNLPEQLQYLLGHTNDDADTLEVLGKDLMSDLLNHGKCHILVDYPSTVGSDIVTLADEVSNNIRPYFSRIDPLQAIAWTYDTIGAKKVLSSFRIFEDIITQSETNQWEEVSYQQVKVIRPDVIEIWRNNPTEESTTIGGDAYTLADELPNTLGRVNVITVYANKTGFMTAKPVLEELAHLNIKHWNKLSDLDNIEHVANVPFAYATGVPADQLGEITISAHGLLTIPETDVKIEYLEHSGAAIGASQRSMEMLEARMVAMGADTLAARPTATRETASSKIMDNTKSNSVLQSAVVNLEAGLLECFKMAAEWISLPELVDVKVNIGDKMTLSADANVLTTLVDLARNKNMSFEDLALELQRRGSISESTELKAAPEPTLPEIPTPLGQPLTEGVEDEENTQPLEDEEGNTED